MDQNEPPSREFFDYVASLGPKVVRSEDDKMNWPQRYIKTDKELAFDKTVLPVGRSCDEFIACVFFF
jgi:hypothetical protein